MLLIEVNIPGRQIYRIKNLVLDLNGTIALDGNIIGGVKERLETLSKLMDIFIITADTLGRAQELEDILGVSIHKVTAGAEKIQKLQFIHKLGSASTVAIGNGSNDASMLKESTIGVCVLGAEGAASETLTNCDVVASDINIALDLLIKPERLIATLRK